MSKAALFTFEDLKSALEKYCAYQERCHYDVQQKMYQLKVDAKFKDAIMVHLIENDYLNEERYALAFVRGKHKIKKWGRNRLKAELRRRQVSDYLIKKALATLEEGSYIDTFNILAQKKSLTLTNYSKVKQKRKLADYLIYRGWESHLVYDKVNELIKS